MSDDAAMGLVLLLLFSGSGGGAARVDASGIRGILDKYGREIVLYNTGAPRQLIAAIIDHESGGRMDAPGDPVLDEVGLMQVTVGTAERFGVDPGVRYTVDGNIFLGQLELAADAARWQARLGHLADTSTQAGLVDLWKLARLSFSIGDGAAEKLAGLMILRGGVQAGGVFDAIYRYAAAGGELQPTARQTPAKIRKRILGVQALFDVAYAAGAGGHYHAPHLPAHMPSTVDHYKQPPGLALDPLSPAWEV